MYDEIIKSISNEYVVKIINNGGEDEYKLYYGVCDKVREVIDDAYEKLNEDDELESFENPIFLDVVYNIQVSIKNDPRIKVFKKGSYLYKGNFENLAEEYICSAKYKNPFEDINREK